MESQKLGILGPQDVGGLTKDAGPLDQTDYPTQYWEKKIHSLLAILALRKILVVDELRRAVEHLPKEIYDNSGYYGRWARAFAALLLEKGLINAEDLRAYLPDKMKTTDYDEESKDPRFKEGDVVRIKPEDFSSFWVRPHLRTPGYIHGVIGKVKDVIGKFHAPNTNAFWQREKVEQTLYRIEVLQRDVWAGYKENQEDIMSIEIFEPWLELSSLEEQKKQQAKMSEIRQHIEHEADQIHCGDDHHHDDHDHEHEERTKVEQNAIDKEGMNLADEAFADGFLKLLAEKGVVTPKEINDFLENQEMQGSVLNGAKVIVRAWRDPGFRKRLEEDANAAVNEFGFNASNPHAATKLVCCFNEKNVQHVIVCTLCSCYPGGLLGGSPGWYKSRSYRSRVVVEPRKVLAEFGTVLPKSTKIVIHDSTADCRYMVVPTAPENLDSMSDEELFATITRDRLIGVKP